MPLEKDISFPDINFPLSGTFKMVQLMVRDSPVMLLGKENTFHARILEDYLSLNDISFDILEIGSSPKRKIPQPLGADYKTVGMGKVRIDADRRELSVGGFSVDYEVRPSEEFTQRLKKQLPNWTISFSYSIF